MSKVKYIKKIKEFISQTPAFSAKDIEKIVRNKKYTHLLLHNLEKVKKIFRLTKGFYSAFQDPAYSVFCFKPAYLGLYEALSLHNFWEQETNVVIITSRKVRSGIREILDTNVIIKRITPKYLFGLELIPYDKFYLPVSDLEKTLIDFYYFKELPPKNLIKKIIKKVDSKKLKSYLKNYPQLFQRNFLKAIKL